ncbi:thiamine pyrophosphate-dependent enzyme [Streptomyces iconiensis]|uniref:Thiamine pyrophosphate-dependent enzyme n=1 Tax=Streptomyces iconiensis TaxID=1384038 RepID=A0ABT6ZYS4_9ACTN|nr:thiamine pyrophosphate-dependent enzyme [Streptomyces iconiensis]MDJ1134225.1 thiamine pyrophosphate-dependent enzyme [Streptomyces iconiensis]
MTAVAALQEADLLLALGTRFDDRVTGELDSFAPDARVIHVDIDAGEIGRKRRPDVGIVADCAPALSALLAQLRTDRARQSGRTAEDGAGHGPWLSRLEELRQRFPLGYSPTPGALSPHYVTERLGALTSGPGTVYTAGVGQHQMWAAQLIPFERPRSFVNSGGAGTMGYALPAAMGVKAALPDARVWAIDGDGSFQMTNQELAACVHSGLPIKVAVINNGTLGMVRQWQDLFYDREYAHTDLSAASLDTSPDIAALARAYGCAAFTCERAEDVDRVIQEAAKVEDRPVLVEFMVSKEAMVWPMVPAGMSNDDLLVARNLPPDFGDDA